MSSRLGAGLVLGMCLGMPTGLILFPPIPETKIITVKAPTLPPEIKVLEKVETVVTEKDLPEACYDLIASGDRLQKSANQIYTLGSNMYQHLHDLDQQKIENSFDLFETEVYLNRNLVKMRENLYGVLEESDALERRRASCKEEVEKD